MGGGFFLFLSFWVGLYHHRHHHHHHHYHLSLSLSSYRSVQYLRTLGLIACEADRIGIRGSRSWSWTCAVSSVIPRLLLLTDFDKREHPTTATARRSLYGARRASRLFSTDFFSSFFSFFVGGNRPRTFNDPTLVNPSSYSYAHSTARRKQEAHAGRSPEHCRGTHHQSAKRARPPKGTRERQKIFASRYWAAWRTLPFRLRHGQHATSTIFFWYGVVVLSLLADPARGFWSLWMFISRVSFLFSNK